VVGSVVGRLASGLAIDGARHSETDAGRTNTITPLFWDYEGCVAPRTRSIDTRAQHSGADPARHDRADRQRRFDGRQRAVEDDDAADRPHLSGVVARLPWTSKSTIYTVARKDSERWISRHNPKRRRRGTVSQAGRYVFICTTRSSVQNAAVHPCARPHFPDSPPVPQHRAARSDKAPYPGGATRTAIEPRPLLAPGLSCAFFGLRHNFADPQFVFVVWRRRGGSAAFHELPVESKADVMHRAIFVASRQSCFGQNC
jgi:hypothetical protein